MTAYLVGLRDGSSSMPGRYPVLFYAWTVVFPSAPLMWVGGIPFGLTLALFFTRPPEWWVRVLDPIMSGKADR